jgi:hypothetical protein
MNHAGGTLLWHTLLLPPLGHDWVRLRVVLGRLARTVIDSKVLGEYNTFIVRM